ncbi:MAG: nuclear transport factor 2 family protein [Chloroflexi bacterium]|nr:MAG: nuclear transport factor 2 family protein [Chloroflexota bacterium]
MLYESPFAIVQAWQDAANSQNIDRLIELSAPTIEIVGPRGSGHGHQLLRDWLGRAGLHLTTLRAFAHDNIVVLAQHGVWRSVETGEVAGERNVASRFRVDGQRIVQFARYDNLDIALDEAGLHNSDEIPIPL